MANISKLNEDIDKLKEKIRKKKRNEKIKEVRVNRSKRKKRAVHLFILGNIFKTAKVDTLPEETLIGYCLNYNKVNPVNLSHLKLLCNF